MAEKCFKEDEHFDKNMDNIDNTLYDKLLKVSVKIDFEMSSFS